MPIRFISHADLPPLGRAGRIADLLAKLLAAPDETPIIEIPCENGKKATGTFTQIKTLAKTQGHTVKGGAKDAIAYAWIEVAKK